MIFSNSVAFADVDPIIDQLNSKPYKIPQANSVNNQSIYSRYCTGKAYDLKKPYPKYDNPLVAKAAGILKQTEVDANIRLKEIFTETWGNTINSIRDNLGELKDSSNPVVINLSEKIESSLDLNATKFTKQQTTWFETIVAAVYVDIKVGLSEVKKVIEEFQGVDFKELKKMVTEFKEMIAAELGVVDIPALKTLAQSFSSEIRLYEGEADPQVIINAFKVIEEDFAKIGSEEPDSELNWMVDDIKQSIKQLEGDPSNLEYAYYTIDSVLYYFNFNEDYNFSEEALVQAKLLREQQNIMAVSEDLTILGELVEAIDNYVVSGDNFDNVKYAAQNLQGRLSGYVELSKNQQFIDNVKFFENEVASFNSESLKESVNTVLATLKDNQPLNDVEAASEVIYLNYEIENVEALLSETTKNKYKELHGEASKVEQNNLKNEIDKLIELTVGNTALQFLEEASWKMSSLSRSLVEQKGALSLSSQQKVDEFSKLAKQLDLISSLKYLMSSEVELKKAGHYYFYGAVKRIYKTDVGNLPYGRTASRFLVQLCGEFRDRATMIEAKLKWIERLYTLPKEQITTNIDFKKNIWKQMSAEDYYPYLDVTSALWQARLESKERFIAIGKYTSIDNPIEGPTVCETKYIFEKYVKKGKSFDDLETYVSDYESSYRQLCSADDQVDYYDFRGDSNFKHYSPESNGMIWKATSIARACKSQWKAYNTVQGQPNQYTDEDCQDYFKRPFYYRYNAARAALATGLFYSSEYGDSFDSQGNASVTVYTHMAPQLAPYGFETETSDGVTYNFAPEWLALQSWNQPDMGFNDFTGLGTDNADAELAYERLRGSVDRHTNWYSAGYNDGNGVVKEQAFSPFVASSYVMSASDDFTTCGITVQCPPDGLKRWMFVFRVKPQNWYNPQRILDNETIDFDKMWFDETSFGDSGLANGESAWDRMGTAMEEELDSILYLINVGGEEWGDDDGPLFEDGGLG